MLSNFTYSTDDSQCFHVSRVSHLKSAPALVATHRLQPRLPLPLLRIKAEVMEKPAIIWRQESDGSITCNPRPVLQQEILVCATIFQTLILHYHSEIFSECLSPLPVYTSPDRPYQGLDEQTLENLRHIRSKPFG